MPIKSYFKGYGNEVMAGIVKQVGDKKMAQKIFYATANKKNMTPKKGA